MRGPIAKSAVAAAVILAALLSTSLWERSASTAYAIEQTFQALQNVRFLHIIRRDETDRIVDERWIEIGMDGWQVRYRQQNPPSVITRHPGAPLIVIEDGYSTAVYRADKKAVILYDREEKQYQWIGRLGEAFENLRQEGKILDENAEYQGQAAHKVWWPCLGAECYVDPATKLPMAIGETELSYEAPPAGTFDIFIPDGYAAIDRRPGAEPTALPDWLLEEEQAGQRGSEAFEGATRALVGRDFATAAEFFEQAVQQSPGRNWAWFWLGSAYYEQGHYELAIEKFNKVLEIFGNEPCYYGNYARGLAYAHLGMSEAAARDFEVCLPTMVRTLRIPSAGSIFEYADNPLIRCGRYKPSEQEVVTKMVNRLRLISGQSFGFDPNNTTEGNEQAIAAWERWLATDGGINVTLDAPLIELPAGDQ